MFESVLIANRGEIACRVIRTARSLGLRTIAVYSDADARSPHVTLADEAHRIGPAAARESYLNVERILDVAQATRAACIHPGYGFLSERAEFAEACEWAGIAFVGPPPSAIRAMGLKDAAKALVEKAGVPVVPGYHGERQDAGFLKKRAENVGFPVLIKAIAGGGGKGMKRVDRLIDFEDALGSAQREARAAFGDDRVLVEKYVLAPRHVEIQVFADRHGNVVHLFERDCSLQRRHQKVIEEAPAPGMTAEVREAMGRAAVEAARAVGYVGAGTVEFIADGREGLRADRFYFMEMNTRLQVEHPVTEAITGLDLVEWQLRVAAGERLPKLQDELRIDGHAVEARVYAEDPQRGFLPSTGRLVALELPEGEGIRVDSGVEEGGEVTPHYDPMIAKVIAHGATRDEALDRLSAALAQTVVAGPRSNVGFLRALADAPGFRAGEFDTGFIDRNLAALGAEEADAPAGVVAAAVERLIEEEESRTELAALGAAPTAYGSPWSSAQTYAFQLAPGPRRVPVSVLVDGRPRDVAIEWHEARRGVRVDGEAAAPDDGVSLRSDAERTRYAPLFAVRNGAQTVVALQDPFAFDLDALDGGGGGVVSPMHGKLVALFVAEGDEVDKGTRVAVVEAMKMEHVLQAPRSGRIGAISAQPGEQVAEGFRILTVEDTEEVGAV